jgi:glycosyltransferase involved in cell wall biosynthesis
MNDILYYSMEDWEGVWRRNQNVVAKLARRHPDRKILYITLTCDLSHAIRRRRFGQVMRHWRPEAPKQVQGFPNVYTFAPIKWLPNTITMGLRLNEAHTRAQIRRAVRQVGLVDPILYVNPHYAAHLAGRMGETVTIYDIGDDWSAMNVPDWLKRRILFEDEMLAKKADANIVVSELLAALRRKQVSEVHVIPNGVDLARYVGVAERAIPPHPITTRWAKPVIGHSGTMHSDRTDVDLVLKTARAFPAATIAMVGPIHTTAADTARMKAEPNIKLTGPVDFVELPSVMSAFDVCIVPHQVNQFTEGQSPLKLFEYLAAGLPIVSTPINGFRDYPELVHLGDTHAAFIARIMQALCEPRDLLARRRHAAQPHSWDARVNEIEAIIEQCLARKAKAPAIEPAAVAST